MWHMSLKSAINQYTKHRKLLLLMCPITISLTLTKSRGARPLPSVTAVLAPCLIRILTMASLPCKQARCSGVIPSLSLAFTSAPVSIACRSDFISLSWMDRKSRIVFCVTVRHHNINDYALL